MEDLKVLDISKTLNKLIKEYNDGNLDNFLTKLNYSKEVKSFLTELVELELNERTR